MILNGLEENIIYGLSDTIQYMIDVLLNEAIRYILHRVLKQMITVRLNLYRIRKDIRSSFNIYFNFGFASNRNDQSNCRERNLFT